MNSYGLNDNWCALYAAIINPKLSSVNALMCFGIRLEEQNRKPFKSTYKPPRKEMDLEAAWKMYEKGATLKEVGKAYGISITVVRSRFVEAGRKCRGKNNYSGGLKMK